MHTGQSKSALRIFLSVGSLAAFIGILVCRSSVAEKLPSNDSESNLTDTEFDRIHQKLTRMSTEKVWSIPWQLSVRKARQLAAKENKPVFLWISSNGGTHPLGPC